MDKIKNVAQRLGIITVEDMERYTALELIIMIANKMNELVDDVSRFETDVQETMKTQNEKIQHLLGEGLLLEVENVFNEWIEDGTFDRLINQSALKEVNDRIDETNAQMKKSSFLAKVETGFIAHRGSHINAPENTLKSIHQAGLYGYEMVEIDVNCTKDGHYVLMHDDTVDRTTDGTGRVDSFTLAEIKQLRVIEDFSGKDANEIIRIPTLEEAVQECCKQGLGINLDCSKLNWTQEICEMAVSLLKKYGLYGKSFFVISNPEQRQLLTSLYPDANVTWLAWGDIEPNIIEAKKYQNAFITYSVSDINAQMIARCHEENIPVFIYSCNDWDKAYSMIKFGVRFVETDWILAGGEF